MFKIGDKVVYPMHGAGVIEGIEEKEILGEKRKYFVMRLPIGDMKVMVPVDNVEDVGVRDIIGDQELKQVMSILRDDKSSMPQNWNRRYRANMDRIKSGDIFEIAAVVRNLLMLDMEKGLSTGERKMLSSAKQMLLSEMVLSTDSDIENVEKMVVEAIEFQHETEETESVEKGTEEDSKEDTENTNLDKELQEDDQEGNK